MINETNPGAICLQETKLGDKPFNFGLNYCFYRSPPIDSERAKGGAAIIIKKSVQQSSIDLNTRLQAVAVRVLFNKFLTICSIYLPPDCNFNCEDLQDLIDQLPPPFLILGDFNAHNPLWGSILLDHKGKTIEDILDRNSISLFNDGRNTYHNVHTGYSSAIDLSICSSNLLVEFEWSVEEELRGSDHYPIYLKGSESTSYSEVPKWKIEAANWTNYKKEIIVEKEFEVYDNHIEAYEFLTECMLQSGEDSIPKTTGNLETSCTLVE